MKSDIQRVLSGLILPDTAKYPEGIKQRVRPALPIYYRGNVDLLSSSSTLSVIGSRAVTATNERNIHHILDSIINPAICIVSGLALGMDALAHEIALENGLPTIAVLGSSVEAREVYPSTNRSLAEHILEHNGLLISPFPPGTNIMPYNFPIRNQLIAALGQATLVASAAKRSGALITARLALEYGADVFVIPGNSFDSLYEGSNLLLQQGAQPILSANDILDYFKLTRGPLKEYQTENTKEQALVSLLQQRSYSIQELLLQLPMTSAALNTLLTTVELKGWIEMGADGMVFLK